MGGALPKYDPIDPYINEIKSACAKHPHGFEDTFDQIFTDVLLILSLAAHPELVAVKEKSTSESCHGDRVSHKWCRGSNGKGE